MDDDKHGLGGSEAMKVELLANSTSGKKDWRDPCHLFGTRTFKSESGLSVAFEIHFLCHAFPFSRYRRTSELFMKYLHRQPPNTTCRAKVEERIRTDIADLMTKEQSVLEAWAAQRRRFEECVKFVTIEVSHPSPSHVYDMSRQVCSGHI